MSLMQKHKPRRKHLSLKRTIASAQRRKLAIDKIKDHDLRWLFAGYKKGAFPENDMPQNMEPTEFNQYVVSITENFSHTLVLRDKHGRVLALLLLRQVLHMLEATTYHMPWSADRDKIAGAIMYFGGIAGPYMGLKYCAPKELNYCKQLARYGVLKKVGEIQDFYRIDEQSEPAVLFQTKEIDTPWTEPLKMQMAAALLPYEA